MTRMYDAHIHLQDTRFNETRNKIVEGYSDIGIKEVICNGTCETDWGEVAQLAEQTFVRPAFGLHPWKVKERSEDWLQTLTQFIEQTPHALIGEIGLDKWIRNPAFNDQIAVFESQLELSIAYKLPPTIHCLKAWGSLLGLLQKYAPLPKGFLLHSYAGPSEMLGDFIDLGAYFSISGYFARPDKAKKLETWQQIPIERILVETDAPDMLPPESIRVASPLSERSDSDGAINHPHNIAQIYRWFANHRGIPLDDLQIQIARNYQRIFG